MSDLEQNSILHLYKSREAKYFNSFCCYCNTGLGINYKTNPTHAPTCERPPDEVCKKCGTYGPHRWVDCISRQKINNKTKVPGN
jgi:hypothetical protein